MATRLRYESMIRQAFPNLEKVRACSPGPYKVVIYASEHGGWLSEEVEGKLKAYLQDHGQAHVSHEVKSYIYAENDGVAEVSPVPEDIEHLALTGSYNQKGIIQSMNAAFPFLKVESIEVDGSTITIRKLDHLSDGEQHLLDQYAHELIPLGIRVQFV